MTGLEIKDYIEEFYGEAFKKRGISFSVSEEFENIKIYDQPARILPVFINLVNNSRYWVNQVSEENKQILLDYVDNEIYISDTGPGVDRSDLDQLFTLFFLLENSVVVVALASTCATQI